MPPAKRLTYSDTSGWLIGRSPLDYTVKNGILNLFPLQQHISKIYLYIHRLPDLIILRLPLQDIYFFYIPSHKTEGLYTQNMASHFLTFIITEKGLEALNKGT